MICCENMQKAQPKSLIRVETNQYLVSLKNLNLQDTKFIVIVFLHKTDVEPGVSLLDPLIWDVEKQDFCNCRAQEPTESIELFLLDFVFSLTELQFI